MKVQTLALLAGFAVFAVSCGTTKTYSVNAKSGTQTGGTAKFTQNGNEVTMKLDITNLTPGIHAVHIHEKGDCSAADGTSTGGHWNPSKNDHGKWGAEHFHMGDIGNLVVRVRNLTSFCLAFYGFFAIANTFEVFNIKYTNDDTIP